MRIEPSWKAESQIAIAEAAKRGEPGDRGGSKLHRPKALVLRFTKKYRKRKTTTVLSRIRLFKRRASQRLRQK